MQNVYQKLIDLLIFYDNCKVYLLLAIDETQSQVYPATYRLHNHSSYDRHDKSSLDHRSQT